MFCFPKHIPYSTEKIIYKQKNKQTKNLKVRNGERGKNKGTAFINYIYAPNLLGITHF